MVYGEMECVRVRRLVRREVYYCLGQKERTKERKNERVCMIKSVRNQPINQ